MKMAIVLSLLASSSAFASFNLRPSADTAQRHVWFCTADGYDYNNARRQISGSLKGSKVEAAQDALRACRAFYAACRVGSCFQEQ